MCTGQSKSSDKCSIGQAATGRTPARRSGLCIQMLEGGVFSFRHVMDRCTSYPLAVAVDHKYAASGYGLVPSRTVYEIWFNVIRMSRVNACAEIGLVELPLVQKLWSYDCYQIFDRVGMNFAEISKKCASPYWLIRNPNTHYLDHNGCPIPRHPPISLIYSGCKIGPRFNE